MKLAGYRSRVRLNLSGGVDFYLGVSEWSFADEVEEHDLSNSEGYLGHGQGDGEDEPTLGPGTDAHLFSSMSPAQPVGRIELMQPTLNEQNNPLDAGPLGLSLRAGRGVSVRIWPNRDSDMRHYFPNAVVVSLRRSGNVQALTPLQITLRCDGSYFPWSNL